VGKLHVNVVSAPYANKTLTMDINPQILTGHWNAGYALDLHTVSSFPQKDAEGNNVLDANGKIRWDTTYTPIGLECII